MKLFDWIYKLLRWGLGLIFIYAGIIKLAEPEIFAVLIDAYGIVPESLIMPVALILPSLEVFAGAGLIFDIKGSLSIIAGLLMLFMVILAYGIWMGLDVDCGCFGPEDPESRAFHSLEASFYRDAVMLTAGAFLYAWRRYRAINLLNVLLLLKKRR